MISAKLLMTVTAIFLFAIFTSTSARTGEKTYSWNIVKEHSSVNFAVTHLMVSKVRGTFREFSGTVTADRDGRISALEGIVMTGSIDTGIKMRDDHLRSPEFFDSVKYPEMKAVLKKITWNGDKFTADGELTIKGITKPMQADGEFHGARMVDLGKGDMLFAGYSVMATVNRKDFGLNFSRIVNGTVMVGDMVEVYGDLEMAMPAVK